MEQFYNPRVGRRILIAFLDLFNNMQVYNYDTSGNPTQIINVPIKYGPGEKYHLFNVQAESGKKYYAKVPSMLLTLNDMVYNSDRATSVNEERSIYDPAINLSDRDNFWKDVQPTPYDYNYTLEVVTESMDHLFQIFENILPYFNPTNHLRIKEFEFLNMERNLRVKLESTSLDYPQEMGEDQFRYFNGKITFSIHGYIYRPFDYAKVIKYIKTNYIYDGKNAEKYSTSGVANVDPAPDDYTFSKAFDKDNTLYTKVSDTEIINNDQIWDAGINDNTDTYVFRIPQLVNAANGGVGEYPDAGIDAINIEEYVFTDGTYAENII